MQTPKFKPGSIVKFAKVVDPGDETLRFAVLLDEKGKVDIQLINQPGGFQFTLKPVQTVNQDDLVIVGFVTLAEVPNENGEGTVIHWMIETPAGKSYGGYCANALDALNDAHSLAYSIV